MSKRSLPDWINFLSYRLGKLFYHRWYYNQAVWQHTFFLGQRCMKSVGDLWNYQEIIYELKPSLVIEFGTFEGGATLFFSLILKQVRPDSRVLTVDVNHDRVASRLKEDPHIVFFTQSSTSPETREKIRELRSEYPGPAFVIADSNHDKSHVYQELLLLREVLVPGDYLIVEDTNINGHPVLHGFGAGPMEALLEFEKKFPGDFVHDTSREHKFGFTFAPNGFLRKSA